MFSTLIIGAVVAVFAGLFPLEILGDMVSAGTLIAFILVCVAVIVLRQTRPNVKRPFKTPLYPIVCSLGAIICTAMIVGLDAQTLKVAFIWMGIGLVIYFAYSRGRSKLHGFGSMLPNAKDFQEKE